MNTKSVLCFVIYLTCLTGPAWAQDPVMDFIVEADRLAQAGEDSDLADYVAQHEILLGAAVGELIDIALQIRSEDPTAAEENVAFAEQLLALSEDSRISAAVEDYRRWGAAEFERRSAAKLLEAAAQEARGEGELDVGVERLHAARSEFEAIGDRRSLAILWGSLGVMHWYRGDWDAVRSSYQKALELRRAIGDAILEGRTLNGLGSVNFTTGDLSAAVEWYELAIEKRRETQDLAGLGTSLGYAANCRLQLGETEAARALYQESLPVLEATGNAAKLIETLNGVGNLQHQTSDYEGAEASYRRGLALAQEQDAPSFVPLLHVNLANTLRFSGRMREALEHLGQAGTLLEGAADPALRARLEQERATISIYLGEKDDARNAIVSATRSAAEAGDPGLQTDVALTTSTVYRDLGALDRSLATALEARTLAKESGNTLRLRDAYLNSAVTRKLLGDYDTALEEARQALELDREAELPGFIAQDEMEIANILASMNRSEEARVGFRRAIQLYAESGQKDSVWIPVFGMGDTFEDSDPDSAVYWYDRAFSLLESDRSRWGGAEERSGFLSNERGAAYEEIARYYARLHEEDGGGDWLSRALSIADRAKARGLQEQLNTGATDDGILDASSIESIRRTLPSKTAVLAFAVGDSASFAWVLDRKGIQQYRLPKRGELRARMQQLRDAVARPGDGDAALREAAYALYSDWIAPAEKQLKRSKHLRIIADDALHELPFSLLLRERAKSDEAWGELAWFGETWSTSYLPSVSLLLARDEGSSEPFEKELLAVGNVRFSPTPPPGATRALAALPHTAMEVEQIASTVGEKRSLLLFEADATKLAVSTALAEVRPRVLHLATHGIVDPFEPTRSCVALSEDAASGSDGYWFAGEVLHSELPCELVVLSACETGRGRLERGEGVVGLTRSFLAAGAREVVASLWAVSDASTARLMDGFYHSMYDDHRSTAESLQAAREQLREDPATAHPFHWAAFVATAAR